MSFRNADKIKRFPDDGRVEELGTSSSKRNAKGSSSRGSKMISEGMPEIKEQQKW